MENETLVVIDESGQEIEMQILFTFEGDPDPVDASTKMYVLYFNPAEEDGSVYASQYTDDGQLKAVESEKEWDMIEEVFATFLGEDEEQHVHE